MNHLSSRALLAVTVVVTLGSAPACGFFRRLGGNDTINLEKADVKSMSVDIRRQQKTICPRQSVQMAVFAEILLDGEKGAKPLETWTGHGGEANKNDKLDFAEFAFHSEQGNFDRDGWFAPNPNLLQTASKEFEIKSVFKRRPDKFSFTTTYKPDYTCIKEAGANGPAGQGGSAGNAGAAGQAGNAGTAETAGGAGGDGGAGTSGGPGSAGGAGPHLTVYATIVKTAFYERLVAVAFDGDLKDFLLFPEGQALVLHANGGPGGPGGQGGPGGRGGAGGTGNPGGQGGHGGQGGNGGQGGIGGPGGTIEYLYDTSFPELRSAVRLDVSGGLAGRAGPPGPPGAGGAGGSPGASAPNAAIPRGTDKGSPQAASESSAMRTSSRAGTQGTDGAPGAAGTPGQSGPDGRASAAASAVKEKFGGRPEITPL